ncbi:MAG: hypothetical protein V3W20_10415, partial [Candidatus Neomarinimicrobiota bacterium]
MGCSKGCTCDTCQKGQLFTSQIKWDGEKFVIATVDGNVTIRPSDPLNSVITAIINALGNVSIEEVAINVIRVNKGGNNDDAAVAGNYSWNTPFLDIKPANDAAAAGDLIFVDPGTYSAYNSTLGEYEEIGQKDGIYWHFRDTIVDWYYNTEDLDDSTHVITGNGIFTKDEDHGFNTFRVRGNGIKFDMEAMEVTNVSAVGDAINFASSSVNPSNQFTDVR